MTFLVGLCTLVGYFEIIIYYNEPEEGILFMAIYGNLALIFVIVLKYYWLMVGFDILLSLYASFRAMYCGKALEVLSNYDVFYYMISKMIVVESVFYLIVNIINILNSEK